MNIINLKSGTDIRGIGYSESENEVELTDSLIYSVTAAFVSFIKDKTGLKSPVVSVGMDSRLSSQRISDAVIKALLSLGIKTYDCGMSSTPSMFMTTVNLNCDAAVMITASHLPYKMNGLKFFTKEGGFSGKDIEIILKTAGNSPYTPSESGSVIKSAHMDTYSEGLREMIIKGVDAENRDKPLAGLRIAVDAGNGVGGFYAGKVLEPLGADCSGSRYLEPDGRFPNHIPNPENQTAMDSIRDAVISSGSDFGIIFDTDVDRAACVDSKGNEINRNRLVALAAAIALKDCPGGTIVTDSVTSDGLTDFINNNLSGVHRRFKRGYRNVIDEAIRLEKEGVKAPLAIETSGHAAFSGNYYLDDGAYLITRIVIELALMKKRGEELGVLIKGLSEPLEEKEIRYKILLDDFKEYGLDVIDKFELFAKESIGISVCPDNNEGIRVSFDNKNGDGWLLLRMSLHEPLLVMNCESNEKGGVEKILSRFNPFISAFDKVALK